MPRPEPTHEDDLVVIEVPYKTEAFRQLRAAFTRRGVFLVRIGIDGDTIKIKEDEGMWTHPLGGVTLRRLHSGRPKKRPR